MPRLRPRGEDWLQALHSLDPKRIDLPVALVGLERLPPQERGRGLEELLVVMLRKEKVRSKLNAGTALPRQTDVAAELNGMVMIFECKWEQRRKDIDVLDGIRARLRIAAPGTVGCVVSMSGFTAGVINSLRNDRDPEIILVEGNEIRDVALGKHRLTELINEKRRQLRVEGRIWFADDGKERPTALPSTPCRILIEGKETSVVTTRASFSSLHFASDYIPMESYLFASQIEMNVPLGNMSVREALALVHERLELSGGSFAIHQQERSWFGYGATNFCEQIEQMQDRYAVEPKATWHHSESATLYAPTSIGLLVLHLRNSVGRGHVFDCNIRLVNRGIPLDLEPLRELAYELRNDDLCLVIDPPDYHMSERITLRDRPTVEIVGLVESSDCPDPDEPTACGVIVKNPFFNRKKAIKQLNASSPRFNDIAAIDTLVCMLRSHHGIDDVVDKYFLESVEIAQWGGGEFVMATADWGEIKECRCPSKTESARHRRRAEIVSEIQREEEAREQLRTRSKPPEARRNSSRRRQHGNSPH